MFRSLNYIYPVDERLPNGMDIKDVKFEEFSVTDKFLDEKTIEIVTGISAYNRCFSVTEVTNIQN